jgi:AbrB family looped-hinge helix DNA binding protein
VRTIDAKITSQGQVTIPVEVRRHLGLEKGKRVSFVIAEDGVRLEPARFSSIEDVFGSVPAIPGMSEDFDDEIEEAIADELDRKYRSWHDEA